MLDVSRIIGVYIAQTYAVYRREQQRRYQRKCIFTPRRVSCGLVSFCASSSGGIELPLSILAGGEELLALIPLGCAETLPFGMPGGAACSCAAAVFLLLSVFKYLPPE